MAWTDGRLDHLAARMDAGFERVDRDIRDLRMEMTSMRSDLTQEIGALRVTMMRTGGGIMVGLIGVIAATALGGG